MAEAAATVVADRRADGHAAEEEDRRGDDGAGDDGPAAPVPRLVRARGGATAVAAAGAGGIAAVGCSSAVAAATWSCAGAASAAGIAAVCSSARRVRAWPAARRRLADSPAGWRRRSRWSGLTSRTSLSGHAPASGRRPETTIPRPRCAASAPGLQVRNRRSGAGYGPVATAQPGLHIHLLQWSWSLERAAVGT